MKAMLLAAGLGKRLRPITEHTPKPLLQAGERTLIEHHIANLVALGVTDLVVNLHHLGEKIESTLGDGSAYGARIKYSYEKDILETGGGIKNALPLLSDELSDEPFLIISADTYFSIDQQLLDHELAARSLGCLLMVENPPHHGTGDYAIGDHGILHLGPDTMTYAGAGLIKPDLVNSVSEDVFPLRDVFVSAIHAGQLEGAIHRGYWCDVGTRQRYDELLHHIAATK